MICWICGIGGIDGRCKAFGIEGVDVVGNVIVEGAGDVGRDVIGTALGDEVGDADGMEDGGAFRSADNVLLSVTIGVNEEISDHVSLSSK